MKSYLREHGYGIFVAIAVFCVMLMLVAVEYQFDKALGNSWFDHLPISDIAQLLLNHLADAVILTMPFYLLPRRRQWMGLIVVLAVTIWCVAQLMYYPTYRDLMPFSSFLLVNNVNGVLMGSVLGSLRLGLLEVIFPFIILVASYFYLCRKSNRYITVSRLKAAIVAIVFFIFVQLFVTFLQFYRDKEEHNYLSYLYSQYFIVWNRQSYYFTANGFVPLLFHDSLSPLFETTTLSERDRQEIADYFSMSPDYDDNSFAFTPVNGSKPNMILLVVESLNSWAISMEIDGRKVAPTLDSLSRDSASIVALKMKSQVKNGRSSDGVFMYNTGLLPLMKKTVAMAYSERDYPSLPKALKGYTSVYLCCDDRFMWNKNKMAKAYGYNQFYSYQDFEAELKQSFSIVDSILLRKAMTIVDSVSQPYFTMITTTGMHSPYNTAPAGEENWLSCSTAYTPSVRNYLQRVAYFDRQLCYLLQYLKRSGQYENTMIVIASDHNEYVDNDKNGRRSIDSEGDNCALIILNSGQKGEKIESVIGQIDVFPTILDLMGANRYKWKGLGRSLMRNRVKSVAVSPTEVVGNDVSTVVARQKQSWEISHKIITSDYFNQ